MSRWTDEELRELITLWPTHSVSQIAKRLHRQGSEIRSKAKRLRLDGLPPHSPSEHFEDFDVNPPKRRPPQSKIMPPKPPPAERPVVRSAGKPPT
jgi:GcrA cell cycle regulator